MQRPARGGQGLDPRSTSGSSTSGGAWCGLMRASITSGPRAAPVLLVDEGADAVDVGRGVGARERHPEQVASVAGRELAVVDHHDQREARIGSSRTEAPAERGETSSAPRAIARAPDGEDARAGPDAGRRRSRRAAASPAGARPAACGAAGRRRRSPPSSPGSARGRSSRACRSSSASGNAGRFASRPARAGGGGTRGCRGCRARGRPRAPR